MIRPARLFYALPLPVLPLPVAMIKPPFRTALMTLIGAPTLLAPGSLTACFAAVAMPTITT
jgi:hypothetical protein